MYIGLADSQPAVTSSPHSPAHDPDDLALHPSRAPTVWARECSWHVMVLDRELGPAVGMKPAHGRSILPLPQDVVAQIKSSAAIVSLHGVVLELLKNSLDAKATRIEATVDFTLGGCTVEDNGLGIAPTEFRDHGGLGKLYWTSKYLSEEPSLGRHGSFLASLAAMSLMTIVSRHHDHRSHNMVTFHRSKSIDRQLPAPPQHEMRERHGTRVTVRNLFGNLPVRVKQRAFLKEKKAEYDRLWETLKRQATGLLLSWRGQLSLRVRNADGSTSFSLSTSMRSSDAAHTRSIGLNYTLQLLTQAEYISYHDWSSWIPASASTSAISIKGAISLDPAPSKRIQFLSFGTGPLQSESGNNELYDEVNRIFAQSNFGVEEDAGNDDNDRRQWDRRFKKDGYTNRQLTARKGVDRYPMFHLRITVKSNVMSARPEREYLQDDANLQAVMQVLGAMIAQWLSAHHFRPRKARAKRDAEVSSFASTADRNMASAPEPDPSLSQHDGKPRFRPISVDSRSHDSKKKQSKPCLIRKAPDRTSHTPFAEWSRIKSGKDSFLDKSSIDTNVRVPSDSNGHPNKPTAMRLSGSQSLPPDNLVKFDTEPLLAGSLGGLVDSEKSIAEPYHHGECDQDETISWTDPSTQRSYLLNARTGCVLPSLPTRLSTDTDTSIRPRQSTLKDYKQSIRLPAKAATSENASTQWLDGVLSTWDNPIFLPVQGDIQKAWSHDHQPNQHDTKQRNRFESKIIELDRTFSGSYESKAGKLSRAGLESACVLAQLDKKFILAKMQFSASNSTAAAKILVLIDQHAADERVQVEALLSELCTPLPESNVCAGYRSKLGHQSRVLTNMLEKPIQFSVSGDEEALFVRHAASFAAWGILLDTETPAVPSAKQPSILSITTLPPGISERCKFDPHVLITFLRSAIWGYADATSTPPPLAEDAYPNDVSASWVRHLSHCPKGLVDLINSRACRSAIMFNDELNLEECKELVSKLSKCTFPFMCAHGRPSMVPLIDLGDVGGISSLEGIGSFGVTSTSRFSEHENRHARGGFVHAWREWKGK